MSVGGKIARVFTLILVFVGFYAYFNYFNSLKFKEDAKLTTCWGVELFDDVTGEKVIGVEDFDYAAATETLFLSAYDRRAVAREGDAGQVSTQGGIYTLNVLDLGQTEIMKVHDITRAYKVAGNAFHPHGIYVDAAGIGLLAINRRGFDPEEFSKNPDLAPVFVNFINTGDEWAFNEIFEPDGVCDPYDVVFQGAGFVVSFIYSDVTGACREGGTNTDGAVKIYANGVVTPIAEDLNFPNGLARTRDYLVVSETRNDMVHFIGLDRSKKPKSLELPIAPDNLTVDEDGKLYVAGFTNLIDYYFYMKEWLFVGKSPSAVIRIEPQEKYKQTLMFKDDGEMISGATVAQRAGDFLVIGSAWDDNIALCEGMDGLKE